MYLDMESLECQVWTLRDSLEVGPHVTPYLSFPEVAGP